MTPKQKILNFFTKNLLHEIAADHELTGISRLNKEELVAALSRKRSVNIEKILNGLSLEDLKTVCGGMALDDTGRKKADLVVRIMGRDGGSQVIVQVEEEPEKIARPKPSKKETPPQTQRF
jgi:hypothetical protein